MWQATVTKSNMEKDLNSLAYDDVFEWREPSLPNNSEYMRHYRSWYELSPMKKRDDHDIDPEW